MAKRKSKPFSPILFPILQPYQYIQLAERHGFNKTEAMQISGKGKDTWDTWLGHRTGKQPENINRDSLEKLYRVAEKMRWVQEAIAA